MAKKYRLKIPEMIPKKHAWIVAALNREGYYDFIEDDPVEPDLIYETFHHKTGEGLTLSIMDIPEDWLEEIKEEPVSYEEWVRENYHDLLDSSYNNMVDMTRKTFQAGEANNELRHRETFVFNDAVNRFCDKNNWDEEILSVLKKGWKYCKDSHNLK